jgi:hypothetical protein
MSIHDDSVEGLRAEAELNRRRGDRRREGELAPDLSDRRAIDRRKPPGFVALISALFGRT